MTAAAHPGRASTSRPPAFTPTPPSAGGGFGNLPERASALLGQGRSLTALGQPAEPLTEARDLFAAMGYKHALSETDALLARATAAAS